MLDTGPRSGAAAAGLQETVSDGVVSDLSALLAQASSPKAKTANRTNWQRAEPMGPACPLFSGFNSIWER